MTLLARGQPPLHLPAEAREVYDVTGAGDTVIACSPPAVAAGADVAQAAPSRTCGAASSCASSASRT
jgi:D-beta-D-heptose 7-phosphate kinase/D-beta-D-heptose 1-phosphate adenosyltransferase